MFVISLSPAASVRSPHCLSFVTRRLKNVISPFCCPSLSWSLVIVVEAALMLCQLDVVLISSHYWEQRLANVLNQVLSGHMLALDN